MTRMIDLDRLNELINNAEKLHPFKANASADYVKGMQYGLGVAYALANSLTLLGPSTNVVLPKVGTVVPALPDSVATKPFGDAPGQLRDFGASLQVFVDGVNKILTDHHGSAPYPKDVVSIDPKGIRYVRIVKRREDANPHVLDGSVYCFIDKETGDVLKAEGWKKPAKHPRGNIYNPDHGLSRMRWTGPEYLR